MNEPLASIVIPAFNAERFLKATIESALAQTYRRCETIVVDDGSTDATKEIIQSYGAKLRALFGPNRGVSAARNAGSAEARGNFVQYLDADDLLYPHAVASRVEALLESGADVAYSDWRKLAETDSGTFEPGETIARRIEDVDADPEIAAFTAFWCPPAAILYSRGIVEKIGRWREDLPIIQDARFLQDAALRKARFVHVPGVGADYRVMSGAGLSRSDPVAFVKDVFRNACQIEAWWEERGGLTDRRKSALADVYDYTARTLFNAEPALFDENLRRLYRVRPGFRPTWPKSAGVLKRIVGRRAAGLALRVLVAAKKVTDR